MYLCYFYPRPPRGGRLAAVNLLVFVFQFLSTPSARRATVHPSNGSTRRKDFYPRPPRGGRHTAFESFRLIQNFYPRPPRGGRRLPMRSTLLRCPISIHALREEGDCSCRQSPCICVSFLSTPSARRATAKTERKPSAFVSLYTSLHKLQRGACKTNRKITPLLAQTAGIPVRSVWENHVRCLFALAGHQKISTLSCANSGCSPTCSTLVW